MAGPMPLRTEKTPDETFAPSSGQAWAINVLTLALQVFAHRVLFYLVTLGAVAAWLYTIRYPDVIRILATVGYCATLLAPYLIFEHKRGGQ